jgi:Dimerisation and cyclophilin-binding domain of Mon2
LQEKWRLSKPLNPQALLLCFKLQESRIAVVSSTAAATLRQLVMFVFEKVLNEKEPAVPESMKSQLSIQTDTPIG